MSDEAVKTRTVGARRTATRRKVVDAALELWSTRGFTTTTLQQVADAAGVHVQTIYLAFGTKAGLLAAVIELARAGGEDENNPPTRFPWVQELLATKDPARKLRLYAGHVRRASPKGAPLVAVLRVAARDDPEIEAVRARYADELYEGMKDLVRGLQDLDALRADVDVDRAADTLFTLTGTFQSYELLVGERGWSPDEYERWLGDVLCDLLLARGVGD